MHDDELQRLRRHEDQVFRDDEEGFFLPFRDANSGSGSGSESYGADRYLDVDSAEDGRVHVDFDPDNPYWACHDDFSCPLPPPDDWLRVPVPAGETAYAP